MLTTDLDALRVDPRLAAWDGTVRPLGLIDHVGDAAAWPPFVAPPYPLVACRDGDAAYAYADTVVEPPVTLAALVAAVSRNPRTAAIAADLLRSIVGAEPDAALTSESLAYAALQAGGEHRAWLASRVAPAPSPPGRLVARRRGTVLELVIDRPDAHNAIDVALRDALHRAFGAAALDAGIERIVLRAAGRAFSVGGDLAEFGATSDPIEAHAIRARTLPARRIAPCADRLHVHVQGACIGAGLEIAAFAARLTAGRRAWFRLPELAMGLIPGAGGCVSLSRRIGRRRTALLILSGRRIDAATALAWGLIDAIVDEPPADPDAAGFDAV